MPILIYLCIPSVPCLYVMLIFCLTFDKHVITINNGINVWEIGAGEA